MSTGVLLGLQVYVGHCLCRSPVNESAVSRAMDSHLRVC